MNKIHKFGSIILSIVFLSGCGISPNPDKPTKDYTDIDFYCVNDFHGHIANENGFNGVSKLSGFLSYQYEHNPNNEHVFLNAGDLWQETYDSAINRGKLLTEAFREMDCEAMALGNHEFDWTLNTIIDNRTYAKSEDKEFSFLGANIYHYDVMRSEPTIQASELCDSYKIINRGDIKIGIIGGIGVDQLSSITSSNWTDITFIDFVPVFKDLSDYLRTEKECDVIVALIHTPLRGNEDKIEELSEISSVSHSRYVDLGFLGHSHREELGVFNDVAWIQANSKGSQIGKTSIRINKDKSINTLEHTYTLGLSGKTIAGANNDPKIDEIINKYLTQDIIDTKNQVVGKFTNATTSALYNSIGHILGKTTYDTFLDIKENDPRLSDVNIDVVINNGNRGYNRLSNFPYATRGEIFDYIPFTNRTIVAKVLGKDIISECVNYSNPYYTPETRLEIYSNKYYTVAVIDYLLLHKNEVTRKYNYFTSYDGNVIYIIEDYCHDIVSNYLLKHGEFDMYSLNGHTSTIVEM